MIFVLNFDLMKRDFFIGFPLNIMTDFVKVGSQYINQSAMANR